MSRVRTTVTTHDDVLRTLRAEAGLRGVPLNVILAEAVEEKATALRSQRRPRLGVARSTDGKSARDLASEAVAETPR